MKLTLYAATALLAVLAMNFWGLDRRDREGAEQLVMGENSGMSEALVDYNFHIRPILSDKCFLCHGPDTKNNKAGFRLDTAESAYAALKESDGHGIVPGDRDSSRVWQRIISENADYLMPPPEANLALSEDEKELIGRWIEQGAEYKPHWAFLNLAKSVEVPEIESAWLKHPMDAFVLLRLNQEGLTPSKEAAPERWLRRVSFDLTGLPPTDTEAKQFLAAVDAKGEEAYEQEVDRLLASKSYGEHQAVSWLDAARYADSYGFQSDLLSVNWPYRDWVVQAFNDNLPYDEFITWQIAGDLIAEPTEETRLATAYNRLHRLSNEGGAVREEFLVENAADRLHTFGTSVMALTMECARCHDHKYDPISQKDYFQLTAFFNSIPEEGLYSHSSIIPTPSLMMPTEEQKLAMQKLEQEIEAQELRIRELEKSELTAADAWINKRRPFDLVDLVGDYRFDEGKTISNHVGEDKVKAGGVAFVDGITDKALAFDGDTGVAFPGVAMFDRHTPFSFGLWLKDSVQDENGVVVLQKTFGTDVGYNGFDMMLENGFLIARLFRVWPGNGIGIKSKAPIAKNQWQHVIWTYDGSSEGAGMRFFLNGAPIETEIIGTQLKKSTTVRSYGAGHFTLGQRFRDRGFKSGLIDSLQIYSRDISELEARWITGSSSDDEAQKIDYYLSAVSPVLREAKAKLQEFRLEAMTLEDGMLEVSVMEELETPRTTYILERGEYDAPKSPEKIVKRGGFDQILQPFGKDLPQDRLGLAQWVTDPDHPLTSRVMVNRVWQSFFGTGIVKTTENFGLQGELPSHPDLLDWLARDFADHQWDVKRLCKSIVLSATYRQDSVASKVQLAVDPENRLLARGPAYRLSAEQIRDLALAASGLMNDQMGGPPVSPYQPGKDLWKESNNMTAAYRQSKGSDLHRRSLYSVWKRTAPLPNMMAFDATTREVCNVARERTNTPMQALVLLNDVQFVEAARALASQLLAEKASDDAMIDKAFLKLTGRRAKDAESALLQQLLTDQRIQFEKNPDQASQLVQLGDTKPSAEIDAQQLAALTVVCQAILNLDASIWRR